MNAEKQEADPPTGTGLQTNNIELNSEASVTHLPASTQAISCASAIVSGDERAVEDPTAASQRLIFDEIASDADYLESYTVCLKEAARRADRVRVHGYLSDIARCFGDARSAYARLSALAGLGARQ